MMYNDIHHLQYVTNFLVKTIVFNCQLMWFSLGSCLFIYRRHYGPTAPPKVLPHKKKSVLTAGCRFGSFCNGGRLVDLFFFFPLQSNNRAIVKLCDYMIDKKPILLIQSMQIQCHNVKQIRNNYFTVSNIVVKFSEINHKRSTLCL